jgi:hypothetical protein
MTRAQQPTATTWRPYQRADAPLGSLPRPCGWPAKILEPQALRRNPQVSAVCAMRMGSVWFASHFDPIPKGRGGAQKMELNMRGLPLTSQNRIITSPPGTKAFRRFSCALTLPKEPSGRPSLAGIGLTTQFNHRVRGFIPARGLQFVAAGTRPAGATLVASDPGARRHTGTTGHFGRLTSSCVSVQGTPAAGSEPRIES